MVDYEGNDQFTLEELYGYLGNQILVATDQAPARVASTPLVAKQNIEMVKDANGPTTKNSPPIPCPEL